MTNDPRKWTQRFQGQVRITLDAFDSLLALGREYDAMGYGTPPADDGTPSPTAMTDEQLSGLNVSAADVLAAVATMAALNDQMTQAGQFAPLYRVAG